MAALLHYVLSVYTLPYAFNRVHFRGREQLNRAALGGNLLSELTWMCRRGLDLGLGMWEGTSMPMGEVAAIRSQRGLQGQFAEASPYPGDLGSIAQAGGAVGPDTASPSGAAVSVAALAEHLQCPICD